MKKNTFGAILFVLFLGITVVTTISAMPEEKRIKPDKDGHLLSGLWEKYYDARKRDLPLQAEKILSDISGEALTKRYAWDFYDAVTRREKSRSARNWKERDNALKEFSESMKEYDDLLLDYLFVVKSRDDFSLDTLIAGKDLLKAYRRSSFYTGENCRESFISGHLNGLLPEIVRNDYEFVLWNELVRRYGISRDSEVFRLLSSEIKGSYPSEACLEFLAMQQDDIYRQGNGNHEYAIARCNEYIAAYSGKAVSLFAELMLLDQKKISLETSGGTSDDFRNLYAEASGYAKEAASYKSGIDAEIARSLSKQISSFKENLSEKNVRIVADAEDSVSVILRNYGKVSLSFFHDETGLGNKPVFTIPVINTEKSFYVPDTVKVPLPLFDDGDYLVTVDKGEKSKNGETAIQYYRRRLSLALRNRADGLCFYVADWMSGEPAEAVDLVLSDDFRTLASVKDVKVDGFTKLPAEMASLLNSRKPLYLEASCKDGNGKMKKTARKRILLDLAEPDNDGKSLEYCSIFTDKAVFTPGETVKFKAVLYENKLGHGFSVLPSGNHVAVKLIDPQGESCEELDLVTNEYGSVAGEFVIPADRRNGAYRLRASCGEATGDSYITVGNFELPTFDVEFENNNGFYLAGDTIAIKGRIISYSGHPLSSAKVMFKMDNSSGFTEEENLSVASDGTFRIEAPVAENTYFYNVVIKATDRTGETQEFSKSFYSFRYMNVTVSLKNAADGSVTLDNGFRNHYSRYTASGEASLLSEDAARVEFIVRNAEGNKVDVPVEYTLEDAGGKVLYRGSASSGEIKDFVLEKSGLYTVKSRAEYRSKNGKQIKEEYKLNILKVSVSDKVLHADVENMFRLTGRSSEGILRNGENIELQIGAGKGPLWVIVELFDGERKLLEKRLVHLAGRPGESGSLETVSFEYKDIYPDAVCVSAFCFRKGRHYVFTRELKRKVVDLSLPFEFKAFTDKALPGTEYSLVFRTDADVETLVSIFDKSTEQLYPNRWNSVVLPEKHVFVPFADVENGGVGTGYAQLMVRGSARSRVMMNDNIAAPVPSASAKVMADVEFAEEDGLAAAGAAENVAVRSDFSTSLAFEPFLRSGVDGTVSLDFKTSDKLSTFVVQTFSHDKNMRNAVARREMMVTLPVKVSVAEPEYLYKGDKYILSASVSNSSDEDVSGSVVFQVYPSGNVEGVAPYSSAVKKITVPAGESVRAEFNVDSGKHDEIGIKVVFVDDGKAFSDAVLFSVPVLEAEQTITESHSAVVLPGSDEKAVLKMLQKQFSGTTFKGAEYNETDILKMLLDAVPSKVESAGKDVLSLFEALYSRQVVRRLSSDSLEVEMPDSELVGGILNCRNSDGGFGWFEGMRSNPAITAVLLEQLAKLRDKGMEISAIDPEASVKYLDLQQFVHGDVFPWWCGWISMEQYSYVRSLYSEIPFSVEPSLRSEKMEWEKNFKEFKKYIAGYLVPSAKEGRGLEGQILSKARRIRTLSNLVNRSGGRSLSKAWEMKLSAVSQMNKSMAADMQSLFEYAVEHRNGGWYYPNAVMPYRGLLGSELYAHSMLCDLMSDAHVLEELDSESMRHAKEIADGIRLWIMVQKETQNWDSDPAYVDAVNSVLCGSSDVLGTKVISLAKTYRKPVRMIKAAGNGFSIEKHFYKEVRGEDGKVSEKEIRPGEVMHVGDKVSVVYKVHSEENRSFVKLVAFREAAFTPVEQMSGMYGWMMPRPVYYNAWSFTPSGYRDVRTDRTEFFFDVYPEENTTVREDMYVTREGEFIAPAVTIESLYAPHYRANDAFHATVRTEE